MSSSPTTPEISVVIVNWNRRALLERCLESLTRQAFTDFELMVVDNGSTDGSPGIVRRFSLPAVRLIRNEENQGFARAVNQGIRQARGRIIALVNNDVLLDPLWLLEIQRGMATDPRVGMCASKILLADHAGRIDKVGHVIYADGQNYGRGHNEQDRGQYDRAEEVLCPDGAAGAYRAKVFADVGWLDEDFFAYADDADLGLRAQLAGWKCLYIPTAIAHHGHSSTLGAYSPPKIFLVERNRIWLALKIFPWSWIARAPFYSAARYLWHFWALLTKKGDVGEARRLGPLAPMLWAVVRAQFGALRGLPRALRKRREIQKRRKISRSELARLLRRHSITARRIAASGQ